VTQDPDGSDSHSPGDGREADSTRNGGRRTQPEEVELRAYDLSVRVQSEETELEDMVELASGEMEKIMKHSLRGEMEAIEREELTLFSLGDD